MTLSIIYASLIFITMIKIWHIKISHQLSVLEVEIYLEAQHNRNSEGNSEHNTYHNQRGLFL